jgi:sarcosine oxidase
MFDVIVVGLGAMGGATAYHLAERGARVLGIDQYAPPHDLGSSHGESRIIRLVYYEHPLYVPILRRAFELWHRLERDAGTRLLETTGNLMLGQATSGLIGGSVRAAQEHGLPLEEIPRQELQDRYPQFVPRAGFVALLDRAAGVLDAERCVRAHLDLAAARGADLRLNERVISWMPAGSGVRVRTTQGTYEAGTLVLAAGPWMPELLGAIGPQLNVERQTMVWFDPPGERAMWAPGRFPVFMCEFDDGQLIYGFPRGPRGWKVAVHYEGEPVADVRTMRRGIEPADIARVRGAASRLFEWVKDAPVLDAASCLYTDTPDLRFVIDFLPGMPQVLVSSPCSGHGFKFASAIGELQAQLVLDGRCTFDLTPFRIDR